MNKFSLVLLGVLVLLTGGTACGSIPFVAQSEPTATATRRIRPTFTPRAVASPTSEATATEELPATDTPEPTAAVAEVPTEEQQPTAAPTKRPVVAQATKPPAPPPPAQPQFIVNASSKYFCQQDGIFEVMVNAKRGPAGKRVWAGDLWLAALSPGGQLLSDGAGKPLVKQTESEGSISYGSNCQREYDRTSPDTQNGKLDVGDPARSGQTQMIVRFVKSPTDMSPISPDYAVDFGKGGRWWFYLEVK